jgi:hypothetical protein
LLWVTEFLIVVDIGNQRGQGVSGLLHRLVDVLGTQAGTQGSEQDSSNQLFDSQGRPRSDQLVMWIRLSGLVLVRYAVYQELLRFSH